MLYSLDYIILATKRGLAQSVDTWKTRSCLSLGERISVMFWNLFLIWCQLRVILKVILFVVQRTGPSAPTGYHLIENHINLMISSNKKCNYVVAFLIIRQCCEVWCKCIFMCIIIYVFETNLLHNYGVHVFCQLIACDHDVVHLLLKNKM